MDTLLELGIQLSLRLSLDEVQALRYLKCERPFGVRAFCGYSNGGLLCARKAQPLVRVGLRCVLCPWFCLWFLTRCVAFRNSRSDLVGGGCEAVVDCTTAS